MGEEENTAHNGTTNGEMAPQEDSTKVPLTQGAAAIEVKMADSTDVQVDVLEAEEEVFKGLTKEELMKYSEEPFWTRLRMSLMILFWAGWVAMLVVAVVIIILAPRCAPPPSLHWVQESAMMEVDPLPKNNDEVTKVTSVLGMLGLSSFYFPALISTRDYFRLNPEYVTEQVAALLEALSAHSYNPVTDFPPTLVHKSHPWALNSSYEHLFDAPGSLQLDLSSPALAIELEKVFLYWSESYNVSGFLVSAAEAADGGEVMANLTATINANMTDTDIVVSGETVDLADALADMSLFKPFLMDRADDWTYYKYAPDSASTAAGAAGFDGPVNTEQMIGVTVAVMLLPATPIMQVSPSNPEALFNGTLGEAVIATTNLRHTDSIKFGDTQFSFNTTEEVVAYVRTRKGTPGYAVAVNLGLAEEVIDFTLLDHVPAQGTVVYGTGEGAEQAIADSQKVNLDKVALTANETLVVQFVADYS